MLTRFIVPYLTALSIIGAPLALLSSCTPTDRATAATAISTLGPVLCATLVPLIAPDGRPAGAACADVSKFLGAGLALTAARASHPTAIRVSVSAPTCTAVRFVEVEPSRDPGELLCAEQWGGADGARKAIRDALATGHAK